MGLMFVNLLTVIGAAGALVRPQIGLYVYLFLAICPPSRIWHWADTDGNYSKIVGIALIIGWGLHGFGQWNLGRAKLPILALIGFLGWSFVCTLTAPLQDNPWLFMDNLVKIVIPCVIGVTLVNTLLDLKLLMGVIALSVGFLAFRENETYFAHGVFDGDNQTAHIMALGSSFLLFAGLGAGRWWQKLALLALSAMATNAVFFHMSRGGMLGLVAAGAVAFIVLPKSPGFYALLVCGLLVLARLAGEQVIEEFNTMLSGADKLDDSALSRFTFWKAMFQATLDNPIFGVGPRNWRLMSPLYGIPLREGHCAWLQLMAETGFVGIGLLLLFYSSIWWRLFPVALGRHRPELSPLRYCAQAYVVSFACWFVAQLFGSFYTVELPYYIAMSGAGALKVASLLIAEADRNAWEDEYYANEEPAYQDELETVGGAIS